MKVIDDRFEILAQAAEGGMATVYKAYDRRRDEFVAVKVLRRGAELTRFWREGDVLRQLRHPAIAQIVDRGITPDGEPYLVQQWITGPTLRELLRNEPPTARDSVTIAKTVAQALGDVHVHNMIHRDVKPTNIMLAGGAPDQAKLLDFGVVRVDESLAVRLTRTGTVVGTVAYMAPEQALGSRTLDARADVFSLGIVLYECLLGRVPFRGNNPLATRAKIITLAPSLLHLLPPSLSSIVGAMLAKDPAARPSDGNAVAALLGALGNVPADRFATTLHGDENEPTSGWSFVVLSAPAAVLLERSVETLLADVLEVANRLGCTGSLTDDGSALITGFKHGSLIERVTLMTRAALALKDRWDAVPIAVAGGRGSAAERSLDMLSTSLNEMTLENVFAEFTEFGTSRPGVLIEAELATWVGPLFEIETDTGSLMRVLKER